MIKKGLNAKVWGHLMRIPRNLIKVAMTIVLGSFLVMLYELYKGVSL